MLSRFIQKHWAILCILLFGLLVFSALFTYMVKWDSLDQYLPFRYFLSYASDSHGPALWLPYQFLGYPVYGDMQSGFWYPLTWIHMLCGGYGFYSFNMEVLLHFTLAGIGMYGLGKRIGMNSMVSCIMGLSYMCCGHLIGTAHVLTFVISATWMPFVIYSLIDLRRGTSWKNVMKAALFIHLFVSGGYPAFSMVMFYFCCFFFAHWIWQSQEKSDSLKWTAILGIITLVLGSGYLYAQSEVFPWMGRSEALPYNSFFYSNNFSLKHWWTFLFPSMIATDGAYFASDLSMINGYVGLFMFIAAFYAIFRVKHPWKWALVCLIVFALAASAGIDTPLRYWLYRFVPGFDLFRHPALFRIYAIIGVILLGGIGWNHFLVNKDRVFLWVNVAAFSILAIILIQLKISHELASFSAVWEFLTSNAERSELGRNSHLLFLGSLTLLFLLTMIILTELYVRKKMFGQTLWIIFALICLELSVTTTFSIPTTLINDIKISEQWQAIQSLPSSDQEQSADLAIKDINMNTQGVDIKGIWQNLGIWSRKTAVDGYNPFQLKSYDLLKKDTLLLAHGLIYSDQGKVTELIIEKNRISAHVEMEETGEVVLIQNPYPGWAIVLDGAQGTLVKEAETPRVLLGPGIYELSFEFKAPRTLALFYLSMIGFLATLIGVIFIKLKAGYKKTPQSRGSS